MSRGKLRKARKVVEASKADPETYGPIAAEMAATGNVSRAHHKLAAAMRAASPTTSSTTISQTAKLRMSLDGCGIRLLAIINTGTLDPRELPALLLTAKGILNALLSLPPQFAPAPKEECTDADRETEAAP